MVLDLGTHTYRVYLVSRVENSVYWHHICDYFSDVLAPPTGWPGPYPVFDLCYINHTSVSAIL